jgi:hypothetical protein
MDDKCKSMFTYTDCIPMVVNMVQVTRRVKLSFFLTKKTSQWILALTQVLSTMHTHKKKSRHFYGRQVPNGGEDGAGEG